MFRATPGDEPADIYLVRARLSPEGRLLRIDRPINLSDTSAVAEERPVVSGARVAWMVRTGDKTTLHLADLSHAPPPVLSDGDILASWQIRLTRLQETGQLAGIGHRVLRFEPAPEKTRLAFLGEQLLLDVDGKTLSLHPEPGRPVPQPLVEVSSPLGHPGNLVTWAVDRVRAFPWFGSDRMQWVKAVAFAVWARAERVLPFLGSADQDDELVSNLPELMSTDPRVKAPPGTGWPPQSLEPIFATRQPEEGQWRSLADDPFVARADEGFVPLVSTFLRPDKKNRNTRVFVVLWDPRALELRTMSGTREPKTATGETGPGQIPRQTRILRRLVAAFNGGFQATHGEFGMMAEGVVYLPPKPYAATVARLVDGSTGFGTWPNDDSIPKNILDFRQNLTPMIAKGEVNPYHRTWWGGVPPGWEDETRTVRTGLCQTQENFVAYFYGSRIDVEHLTQVMQRARCQYALHLDMNPGHTGLEFYRVAPDDQLPDLGRKLESEWEARGPVSEMPGWSFLGRRMIRHMNLMQFPRYIRTESRDFFFLLRRDLLPPTPLAPTIIPALPNEGQWDTDGHAQYGWPPAVATMALRPQPSRPNLTVTLAALDARWLTPTTTRNPAQVVARLPAITNSGAGFELSWSEGHFELRESRLRGDSIPLATGVLPARAQSAMAAVGIREGDVAYYVEVSKGGRPEQDGPILDDLLVRLGCEKRLFLASPLGLHIGASTQGPGDNRTATLSLVRSKGPGAETLFEATPVVAIREWMPLQAKRVRYFPKKKVASPEPPPGEIPVLSGISGSPQALPSPSP